ncbi:MAG: hypothetical protein JWQ90_800 [Hydrocarboniphaga sp.]|nr:hypothetical protein [Hydrocarboniphaga sp.]MDB5968350.1 hypothetical protein [Hydrocarboniphaga sp.]
MPVNIRRGGLTLMQERGFGPDIVVAGTGVDIERRSEPAYLPAYAVPG